MFIASEFSVIIYPADNVTHICSVQNLLANTSNNHQLFDRPI